MKKYIIKYIDNDGDCCSVWTTANSKEEAIREIKSEYWDIKEIVYITQQ